MNLCRTCGGSRFILAPDRVSHNTDGSPIRYTEVAGCPDCPPIISTPKHVGRRRKNNPNGRDLQADALAWLESHPEAARMFLQYAREVAEAGVSFGVKMIAERVRYECRVRRLRVKDYIINNDHVAYIARWLIGQDPSLERLLKFREVKW